jgi:MFS family permease
LIAGWLLYAAVYVGFALAQTAWQAWALFGVYGIYFGLTEGSERALIADLVGAERRGTAFGWYNLAIGLGALPASILFGYVWDHVGAPSAFVMGAGFAVVAALGMALLRKPSQRPTLP